MGTRWRVSRWRPALRALRWWGPALACAQVAALSLPLACGRAPTAGAAPRPADAWLEAGHPYLYARRSTLSLFTCRWTTDAPIGVFIDADAEARAEIWRAFEAWQSLPLGVRFYEVLAREASLHVFVSDAPVETAAGLGTGRTVTDCALEETAAGGLRAELVRARVDLARRTPADARGADRALSAEEFAGAAAHEIGHALGFQGHTTRRGAVMSRDLSVTRRLGARIVAGEAFRAPELVALYGVPSGHVLREVSVDSWRTDLIDRMDGLADEAELAGPFSRVGDAAARIFWRDAKGLEYGFQIPELPQLLGDPGHLLVLPEARARAALPRSRDQKPQ